MAEPALYAVILAGGRGERFWPLSTRRHPKQFLTIFGGRSLLAQSVDRLEGLIPPDRVWVITSDDLVEAAREAAPAVPPGQIIGEPMGRDTGPAVALAGAIIRARDPHAAFAILTADHVIGDLDRFRATLHESARVAAERHALVTIGIAPRGPSTGFGYIEAGEKEATRECIEFLHARRFVEKPDLPTARSYVESGRYFWNAGLFIWTVSTLHTQLHRHAPDLSAFMDRLTPVALDPARRSAALAAEYPALRKISIDYALMEKADRVLMARSTFAWDDVGSWTALEDRLPADASGNVSTNELITCDAYGNIVCSRKPVALLGVRDHIVVDADGVLMICPKNRAAELKKLVESVRATGRHEDLL